MAFVKKGARGQTLDTAIVTFLGNGHSLNYAASGLTLAMSDRTAGHAEVVGGVRWQSYGGSQGGLATFQRRQVLFAKMRRIALFGVTSLPVIQNIVLPR